MMIWQKWSCSRPHGGRRIQHSFRMQASAYTSTCKRHRPNIRMRVLKHVCRMAGAARLKCTAVVLWAYVLDCDPCGASRDREGPVSGVHAFSSTRVPLNCSGAMYMGVPVSLVAFRYDLAGSLTREMPTQRAALGIGNRECARQCSSVTAMLAVHLALGATRCLLEICSQARR